MHGLNPIAKPRQIAEGFLIHSIFYTIQGEGPFAGMPAVFVRFAGCNLRCTWCDTEFDGGKLYSLPTLITAIDKLSAAHQCKLVVLTGGEPMLQPLHLLIDHPSLDKLLFQIETAGSYWPAGGISTRPYASVGVVCSPKTPSVVTNLRSSSHYDVYWKYIVRASEPVDPVDGLPRFSTQLAGTGARLFRPENPERLRSRIFIQACDENDSALNTANLRYAAQIAMKHGYRLSVQQHKIVGID